jgi:hypothetical protein
MTLPGFFSALYWYIINLACIEKVASIVSIAGIAKMWQGKNVHAYIVL